MHGQHLYLIQSRKSGAFKIGRSSDPERRRKELQTASPFELRIILIVLDKGYLEPALHQYMARYRTQAFDGEWFREDGIGDLPPWIYDQLDLDVVNIWWET